MAPSYRGPVAFRLAHELEGILTGISADGVVNEAESNRLANWLLANQEFEDVHPFSELARHVRAALEDGTVTHEECEDLLFVVGRFTTVNPYFDALRGGVQSLMGLLAGVTADRALNTLELNGMMAWLDSWSHLKGLWPYDECDALVTDAMARGLRPDHLAHLQALAAQFPVAGEGTTLEVPLLIGGVCAVAPEVVFQDKTFVFTGESARGSRKLLADYVQTLGGAEDQNVTKRTDYLVVCADGNPLWAFSCYGRKVEKAYTQRKQGHHVQIIHERDFWDAMVDHGVRL